MNPHKITEAFEKAVADYTGAPYCVAVDNESNALYMALKWWKEVAWGVTEIHIPSHTYPSVPCEIVNAGFKVIFDESPEILKGSYNLYPTNIWDSALRFTADMYIPGDFQCLSFTGQYKRLKTVKGGAILTDNKEAVEWFKRFRFSGRNACSYHEDTFDFKGGHNYYMPHVLASIGLQAITGFYNPDGTKIHFEDIALPYPDLSLSKHTAYVSK